MTVRYARVRIRVARTSLVRLDPYLSRRQSWTLYPRHGGGKVGTGR